MSRCSELRPPKLHLPNREQRPHDDGTMLFTDPGHLVSTVLQSFEHSLLQSRANGSSVLKTHRFYKKSDFVTHSNDRYQLAVLKHFTGRMRSLQAFCS